MLLNEAKDSLQCLTLKKQRKALVDSWIYPYFSNLTTVSLNIDEKVSDLEMVCKSWGKFLAQQHNLIHLAFGFDFEWTGNLNSDVVSSLNARDPAASASAFRIGAFAFRSLD